MRMLSVAVVSMLVIAAAPSSYGGWAVITVHDSPEYLVAGQSQTLTFTIRRHGQVLLSGLSPRVIVKREGAWRFSRGDRSTASPAERPGEYTATITPERTGRVEITIDSDFNRSKIRLLPLDVIGPGEPEPTPTRRQRGRGLFVAKGCVSCHARTDDPALGDRRVARIGPDLTGRRFPVEWLALKLRDPAVNRVPINEFNRMPDLELNDKEIGLLVSYVNDVEGTHAGGRR